MEKTKKKTQPKAKTAPKTTNAKPKAQPKAPAPSKSGKDFESLKAEIEAKKEVFMTLWTDSIMLTGGTRKELGETLDVRAKKKKLKSWEGGAARIQTHITARKRQGYIFEEKNDRVQLVGIQQVS